MLKPLSAAIAIGSDGLFGVAGPIIMTGGAFGSLVAQWLELTDAERTTLLVVGAVEDPHGGGESLSDRLVRRYVLHSCRAVTYPSG